MRSFTTLNEPSAPQKCSSEVRTRRCKISQLLQSFAITMELQFMERRKIILLIKYFFSRMRFWCKSHTVDFWPIRSLDFVTHPGGFPVLDDFIIQVCSPRKHNFAINFLLTCFVMLLETLKQNRLRIEHDDKNLFGNFSKNQLFEGF